MNYVIRCVIVLCCVIVLLFVVGLVCLFCWLVCFVVSVGCVENVL